MAPPKGRGKNREVTDHLAARVAGVVGPEHVLRDADVKASYETDWTRRYSGDARFVVRPGDTAELAESLRILTEAGVPVVPQGGNTGLVGGGVPRGGEVVVSSSRLSSLGEVDAVAGEVTVGAGVTLARLQEHIRAAGWNFGVDLASRDSCTIGGMIATNAGGIRVLRYGPMRAQVGGIEAARVDGSVIRRLPGLAKDNTGYDIPGLLAGSEGTLAIVTRARLRLIPQLAGRAAALLAVDGVAAALGVVSVVRAHAPSLEAAEVFFADGLDLVLRHTGLPAPFPDRAPCYLLFECAARDDPMGELVGALEAAGGFEASAVASERSQRARLWAYRERHTESINAEGVPHKLDVALPLPRLEEFEACVRGTVKKAAPEARPILFGHIADGNLHVNVLGLAADDDRATDAVLRLVAELGGSISAEHGIGVAKTRWLHLTRSESDIAAMRAIKAALDPANLLNPGVIFGKQ
ncbi:MAG: FAD-binding oxidoreductase [Anaerolinea sp.]|nr:FAD-binding oxidoreductase [Anaerolinea sp.]